MGPYREPAEDLEAKQDELDIAAFKATLARSSGRAWRGVIATVFISVVAPVTMLAVSVLRAPEPPKPGPPREPRCETHYVVPPAGDPIPMTVCR